MFQFALSYSVLFSMGFRLTFVVRALFDLMINCFSWFCMFRPKKKKRDSLEDELTERDLKKNVNRRLQKRQNP